MSHSGKLIIFSAPSGSGKTTIVKHLLKNNDNLRFSISATTREQRPHEENGRDYYFMEEDVFLDKITKGEFAEYEQVYQGVYYGTLKSEIDRLLDQGHSVIFDVDVKGALNLKRLYNEKAVAVFVKVPSLEVLEARLRLRQTETEEKILTRLAKAKYERSFEKEFETVLINEDLNKALEDAQAILDELLQKNGAHQGL